MAKRVFISYAQSPPKNKGLVAELVTALRRAGLAVTFDQDVASPQGPPEGWPKWMRNRIEEADWVIAVCNEAYYRRYRGREEPGLGLGACWEGAIIEQALYEEGTFNRKFIPVLFGDVSVKYIPDPLRAFTHYRLPSDVPKLTAALAETPASVSPPVSPPTKATERSNHAPSAELKSFRKSGAPTVAASRRKPATPSSKIVPYAGLSIGAFACGLLVLSLMLWKADTLLRLGLTGRVYYVVLLPLSLSVAAFLFGALRSYAVYSGKALGGALELGGPIVGAALVVVGGFWLVPDPTTFPLTVFVHGEQGVDQIVLRRSGKVIMDLGGDRRSVDIGDQGQAFFPAIPAGLRGQEAPVFIDAEGYELAKSGQKLRLEGSALYLPIRPKAGRIAGRVQDEDGKPLEGVAINVAGLSVNSDKMGHFEVTIPGDRMKAEFSLQAMAPNFGSYRTTVVPGGNEVAVILYRQP